MGSHGHPAGPLSTPPERMQLPSAPRREGLKQPMHLWAGLFAGLCQMSASVRQPRFQAKRVFFQAHVQFLLLRRKAPRTPCRVVPVCEAVLFCTPATEVGSRVSQAAVRLLL